MKTKIQQLRADMMTSGVFTHRERAQIKYLTKANEAQRQYVKVALPKNHLARGWMETCGEVDDWGNVDYCGVPLCPRCHLRERGVQTAQAIKKTFLGAANADLAFATILLPPQLDFSGMTNLLETEKRRLRTFISRQRVKDARWDDFQLLGWWEIDRMSFGDFETCGRNTRLALESLGFPLMEAPNKTIWRPHLHAIVRKGNLTTEEIATALRKETHTAKYQVDIEPFRPNRAVETNLQNIVRYCLKFRIESDYKRPDAQDFIDYEVSVEGKPATRNWWPAEDVREYVDWLCVQRAGFQSLRVVIGRAKVQSGKPAQKIAELNPSSADQVIDGCSLPTDIQGREFSCAETNLTCSQVESLSVEQNHIIEINGVVSSHCSPVSRDWSGNRMSMYNNTIQDTNWTNCGSDGSSERDDRPAVNVVSERPGYAGNVISLSEHMRSIWAKKPVSDVALDATTRR
ncbi:hypothetical protein ASF69_02385 [Rhizobium sp. Leaf311]|uniref:hypothetical protein n=1 Tax=Rhizobium sp. Leaf311 TaxID=1736332 RepID=UPI000714DE38|nr:hypothetical protein [Rhizobium sp. Leaf311]KQQ61275.1 hypothetical protein ASF69_02385 [Rhizobium sp. Leaf311]